jgi:hypothetical protein
MNEVGVVKNLLPLSILCLVLGTVIATAFINPQKFKESKGSVVVAVIASLAIVFLGLNVVSNTMNFDLQVNNAKIRATQINVDKLWTYPNQLFSEKNKSRPEFYASLYYNNLQLYKLTEHLKTKITIESELEEQYLSILLFQCWEDHLTSRQLDKTGDAVWLVNYVQWAQSPYLKENFDRLKYNYKESTILFADLLFEYARKLPIPTTDPKAYKELVQEMLKDQRLCTLYDSLDPSVEEKHCLKCKADS